MNDVTVRDCFVPESSSGQAVPPRNDKIEGHCEERSNLIISVLIRKSMVGTRSLFCPSAGTLRQASRKSR